MFVPELERFRISNCPSLISQGWLTRSEAAVALNCSKGTLDNLEKEGVLVAHYFACAFRYRLEEMVAGLERREVKPRGRARRSGPVIDRPWN